MLESKEREQFQRWQALYLTSKGLSAAQEATMLEGLRSEAEQGHVVAAFRIREAVERKAGKAVSKDYLYDLLHRHGWRKIMPRPVHPRGDWGTQLAFKKNSRSWWEPPPRVLPPRTSGR